MGVTAPPEVTRKPHWWLSVPPPVSLTVAVPPVQDGQTVVAPETEMLTLERRLVTVTLTAELVGLVALLESVTVTPYLPVAVAV
jgi:hypothetical protein